MRIGICVRTWGELGGIGAYTRNIVTNLLRIDDRNQYVIFYSDEAHVGHFSKRENVKEVYVPAKNKLIWDQIVMPAAAKKAKADVILHTKFSVPLFSRIKSVMVMHGTERFVYKEFHPKKDLLFFKTVYQQYFKKADAIIAVSDKTRTDIIKLLPVDPKRVHTVHLATDPLFHVIEDGQRLHNAKRKYSLPERFILYVGHIYPGKNVGRLFQAFARVRRKEQVKLVIAGTLRWKYEQDLELMKKLKLEDEVLMMGHLPPEELTCLYNLAELTVFPSFYESFGLINIEAQACGCPLITSKTGGSPEVAGDGAVYVDPLNTDEIAEAILNVLQNEQLRQGLIEKGFGNVKRFSWEKAAHETLSVLESFK